MESLRILEVGKKYDELRKCYLKLQEAYLLAETTEERDALGKDIENVKEQINELSLKLNNNEVGGIKK